METPVQQSTCYHCGADNNGAPVFHDEKAFCCNGCVSVYQLLTESGLDSFYTMEDKPGVRKYSSDSGKFDWLDDSEASKALIKYSDEKQSLVSFYIPDIHCASCVWLLEKLPTLKKGIVKSEVDYLRKEIRVWFNHNETSVRSVVQMLAWLGYEPMIQLSDLESEADSKKPWRRTYLKLGLAGFAFGNVMLYSFPEYLGLDLYSEYLRSIFTWLSALISIPVLVFSAEDYWKNAWYSIKSHRITMDVPLTIGIFAMFAQSAYELISKSGSGYFDSFKDIGAKLGPFDLAAVPVGAYEPRAMMETSHMNPEEAVQAALDVQADTAIAIHFGTFDLSDEPLSEPPQRFKAAAENTTLGNSKSWVLDVGETREF